MVSDLVRLVRSRQPPGESREGAEDHGQRDDQHGGASRHAGRQRAGLIETDRTDAQQAVQRSTTAC